MSVIRVLLAAALILVAVSAARADTLLLRDGRVLAGARVEETTDGVTVHFANGQVRIAADAVLARYDGRDPNGAVQAAAARRSRFWRSRRKEEAAGFRFETTMSPSVFRLHRDRLLAYFAALTKELEVDGSDPPAVTVSLFHRAQDFRQIAGASSGIRAYYRHVPPLEIAGYDDPSERGSCLRGLQWAVASHVVGLAFPRLPRSHPLFRGLIDYYAAAEPMTADPARFTFGLAVGELCETLTLHGAGGVEGCLEGMTNEDRWRRNACSWAVVHLVMKDESVKAALLERLRGLTEEALPTVPELLGLETDEAREKQAAALKDHVAGLRLTTVPDLVAAGRVAESRISAERVRGLHEEAVALAPDDLEARFALAGALEELDRFEAAARAWRAVLALAPLHVEARKSLARCLERSDRAEDGTREAKLAKEIRAFLEAQ